MAKFNCDNILDIKRTRGTASPYEVLTQTQRDKINAKVEKQILLHEEKLGTDPASVDASQIGGPEGITALEHIVNDVMKEQIETVVAHFKPAWVEANRATRQVKAIKEQVLFHVQNYTNDPIVKKWRKKNNIDKDAKITIKDLEKGDLSKLLGKFWDSILAQNEYGNGHLDRLILSTQGIHWGRMIDEPMTKTHGWDWWDRIGTTDESRVRLLDELSKMSKDKDYIPQLKNNMENDFLKFAKQSLMRMVDENNMAGGKMSHFNLSVKPIFNKFKIENEIKKYGKENVIQRLMDAYDDATVNHIFKHAEARKQYNPLSESIETRAGNKPLSEEEIIGYKRLLAENDIDTVLNGWADKDFALDDLSNTNFRIFKNGQVHNDIIKNFTQEETFNTLWVQFQKLGRNHALVKKFGARPREWFRKFEAQVKRDPLLRKYHGNDEWRDLEAGIKAFVDNRQIATHLVGRIMTGVKNVTVLKLGGIPFEQIFQETFFAFGRMKQNERYRGWNPFKFLAWDSLGFGTSARNNPRTALKFARWDNIAIEHMTGALANRFFGGDVNSSLQMGSWVTGSRRLANRWLRTTQSTSLSDMQAMKSYAYLKSDMTDFLKEAQRKYKQAGEKSAWDWAKKQKDYQTRMLELEEAGIGRDLFSQTARDVSNGKLIDKETGVFDPYRISDQDKPLVARGLTAFDTWSNYFQNRVDAMGRMRASSDNLRKFLITVRRDQDMLNMLKGAIFQFSSFQLGFHQRVYQRDMKLGGYGRVASSFAYLTSIIYLGAITNCQVRQVGRGSGMYSWTDSALHKCAFLRTGTLGKWAVMPFVQHIPHIPFDIMRNKNPYTATWDAMRRAHQEGYGPALTSLIEFFGYGTGSVLALPFLPTDLVETKDITKMLQRMGRGLIDTVKPSMPGLNYFIDMMIDYYEMLTDPKGYRRKQKRLAKEQKKRVTPQEFFVEEPKQLLEWITD